MPSAQELKVSVIIPVYNGGKYISHAIESVLSQTYKEMEIIVVDDGSADRTAEIVKSYQQTHDLIDRRKNLIYIYQKNQGTAAARNKGIVNSTGEYIALLDYDDIWEPEKIELQIKYMIEHQEVGMVHSDAGFIDKDGNLIDDMKRPKGFTVYGRCFKELFIQNKIRASTAVIRSSCLDKIGLFDENIRYCEDLDLWLRLSREFSIGYVNQILCYYRLHDSNMTHNKVEHLICRNKMFNKILKIYPDAWSIVGESNVKKTIFDNVYRIANLSYDSGNYKKAFLYYLKALLSDPFELLLESLPVKKANSYRWYKYKIEKTFKNIKKALQVFNI